MQADDETYFSQSPEQASPDEPGLKGLVEAALFLTGKPVPIDELATLVERNIDDTEAALMELMQDYAFRPDSALEINDTDGYILQVRPDYQRMVEKMLPMELSAGAVRTLSALAIKAPLLQSELIELRGANAYEHIQELIAHKLVSKNRKGRSYLLNVTSVFHQHFRLKGDKKSLEFLVHE
jgi:segregation and condensation protein B